MRRRLKERGAGWLPGGQVIKVMEMNKMLLSNMTANSLRCTSPLPLGPFPLCSLRFTHLPFPFFPFSSLPFCPFSSLPLLPFVIWPVVLLIFTSWTLDTYRHGLWHLTPGSHAHKLLNYIAWAQAMSLSDFWVWDLERLFYLQTDNIQIYFTTSHLQGVTCCSVDIAELATQPGEVWEP